MTGRPAREALGKRESGFAGRSGAKGPASGKTARTLGNFLIITSGGRRLPEPAAGLPGRPVVQLGLHPPYPADEPATRSTYFANGIVVGV
jgi:hypothetical protein